MLRIRFLLDIAFPALVMCLTGILVWGATASDTGYRALAKLEAEVEVQRADLEALRDRRIELEKQADLLNPNSLDPDILDERIRTILGYSREGDIVIPRRELDRLLNEQKH